MERVYIFDTTLRDGEQSPGVSLNLQEKLEIARQLAKLGVDVIEAGFPVASAGDFEAVRLIAREVEGPVIAALARASKQDIDRAWEAIRASAKPRIHTFIATSDIHIKYKFQKTREEILKQAVEAVHYAKSITGDVEFSAEDASRSELNYLCDVITAVIEAGATVVNLPDTVGYAEPAEFGEFIAEVRRQVPNINQAILSVHCHDDLGLAVANSLAAIKNGAQQVEGAINGIGERAGNAALEEVIMGLYTRRDYYQKTLDIKYSEIYRTSKLVSSLTGMLIQPNKAIIGKNAFIHESGIHQDGVLKEKTTYEIMNPQLIGIQQGNLVLGKHSGRHAFKERLLELGFILDEKALDRAFERFKVVADKKKDVTDLDLEAIVGDEMKLMDEIYKLSYLHISSGSTVVPTATIGLKRNGDVKEEASCGDGPVDAAYKAIDKIVHLEDRVKLTEYTLNAITGGKDALGEVMVRVSLEEKVYIGRGLSTDVIEASVKAYVNAINKLILETEIEKRS